MSKLCQELNIQRIPIAVQHPESNGICERTIKTIKLQLNKDILVIQAIFNCNHAIHSITKRMPIMILYRIKDRNPIELRELSHEELLELEREIARENTVQSKRKNSERTTSRQKTEKSYGVGDIVQLLIDRQNREWSKPLAIKRINPGTYIAYFNNNGEATSRHFNEIRKYTKNIDLTK